MKANLLKKILTIIESDFSKLGFQLKKVDRSLYKTTNSGSIAISFNLNKSRSKNYYTVSIYAHVRISSIENIYCKYLSYVKDKDKNKHFTINTNFLSLINNSSRFFESILITEETVDDLAKLTTSTLVEYVLPFLETYSDASKLIANLLSDDYKTWISDNPMSRCYILMANAALMRDFNNFSIYKEKCLKLCEFESNKIHLPEVQLVSSGIEDEYFSNKF